MGWTIRGSLLSLQPKERLAGPGGGGHGSHREQADGRQRHSAGRHRQQQPQPGRIGSHGPASLPRPTGQGQPGAEALGKAGLAGASWKREQSKGAAQDMEARRADILEVSRMGSHEVSEALVSKRATREAEREEIGVSQRGRQRRRGEGPPHSAKARPKRGTNLRWEA